jgi:PleD family two-component response regulator
VPRPTLSVGLASAFCGDRKGAEKMIRRADEALYASKNAGRNRVTAYEDRLNAA